MAGSFTVTGLAAGLQSGEKIIGPVTMTGAAIVGGITDAVLTTGDNTFTVPPSSTAVLIFVPFTNTANLKIRCNLNSGDAGLPIATTGPYFGPWPLLSGTTSVIVNCSAGGAEIELNFI